MPLRSKYRQPASVASSHYTSTESSRSASSQASPTTMSSVSDYDSCSIDVDDFFAKFRDDLDVSDEYPSPKALLEAGEMLVYDADRNATQFKSLYSGENVLNQRQLFVFVRFFYCGACQMYLERLTETITPEVYFTMPIPTSIIIIGCGEPELINQYKRKTGCPWPVYADPSRKLYKKFGMSISLKLGKRPEYCGDVNIGKQGLDQLSQMADAGPRRALKGGAVFQIGGEFLFEDGEVIWCHRMKNVRDHAEISVIKRVLDLDWEEPVIETATVVSTRAVCSPTRFDIIPDRNRSTRNSSIDGTNESKSDIHSISKRDSDLVDAQTVIVRLDQEEPVQQQYQQQQQPQHNIDRFSGPEFQPRRARPVSTWSLYPPVDSSPKFPPTKFVEALRISTPPSLRSTAQSKWSLDSADDEESDSQEDLPLEDTKLEIPDFPSPVQSSFSRNSIPSIWIDTKDLDSRRPWSGTISLS